MPLQALGDDVLLKILSTCDVYTALSVSAVNKSLRCVALAKQLWLSLAQDLAFRALLDIPPAEELQTCSTEDLIAEVKRVVAGPASWSPASSSRPALHRQLKFNMCANADDLIHFRLLPGGRYTVLRTRKDLRICEVRTGRNIWTHVADYPFTTWSIDLVAGGDTARLLLLPIDHSGSPDISVQEVDLTSGQSREVFSFELKTRLERWMSSILGDFFVFALQPSNPVQMIFLLVNWRAQTYVVLNYFGRSYSTVWIFQPSSAHSTHVRLFTSGTGSSPPRPYRRHICGWRTRSPTTPRRHRTQLSRPTLEHTRGN
ncbi:hypothetical protein B0H10DRAFT_1208472 [Mycena sp. CBHHK59/15]|nr:hypothetical protein B0H10DRAFT_1208472 [Mycena sp. CBHHK59/15]